MSDRLRLRPTYVGIAKEVIVRAQVAGWRLGGGGAPPAGLRVLTYHRVSGDRDQLAVTPTRFRRQLDRIARLGVPVVDLADAVAAPPVGDAIALTFDDGYRDFADHALPELVRHGFPATVFVCPAVIAGSASFSWYPPGRQPPLLDWEEMRGIERVTGARFEPHTLTHPDLGALDDEQAWHEIAGSRASVGRELGREPRAFCYPGGYVSERDVRLVERAGYTCAVTTEEGVNVAGGNVFRLVRTQIDRYDGDAVFAARLHGAIDGGVVGRNRRAT